MDMRAKAHHLNQLGNASTLLMLDAQAEEKDSVLPIHIARMLERGASVEEFAELANALAFVSTSALRAEQHATPQGAPAPAMARLVALQRYAATALEPRQEDMP